jgi:hypothetical protein
MFVAHRYFILIMRLYHQAMPNIVHGHVDEGGDYSIADVVSEIYNRRVQIP